MWSAHGFYANVKLLMVIPQNAAKILAIQGTILSIQQGRIQVCVWKAGAGGGGGGPKFLKFETNLKLGGSF